MLVLSRGPEQAICIGEDVEVTVLEVRGDCVRLGIRAPQSVPVHRKEVYLAIREENARAARADGGTLDGAIRLLRAEEVTR